MSEASDRAAGRARKNGRAQAEDAAAAVRPAATSAGTPAETEDLYGAYPRLSGGQVAALASLGHRRRVESDETLIRAGDLSCDFYVILAGTTAVVEGRGTPCERLISLHGPDRFLGELGLLTGEAAFYSAVAVGPGEVLVVPAGKLRTLVASDPGFGDLILRAFLIRRSILIGLGVGLRIIGSRYSADAKRLRDFAARNRLPAQWLDVEEDSGAEALLTELGVPPEDTPIVILYGERLLRNPSNPELAAAVGLPAPSTRHSTSSDLLVVGSGPAGLSAAVYGASEGMETVVLDGIATGGQAGLSPRIENYLGFPSGLSGAELAVRAVIQARKFGAKFTVPAEAMSVVRDDGQFTVQLDDGNSMTGTSMVIATGARYRRPDLRRLEHFEKASVYYAASQAEAMMCRGDPIVIVGGGNSAGQATVFLSRYASSVTVVVREPDLAVSMSRYLIDRISRLDNVTILLGTQVQELMGNAVLEAVAVADSTGRRTVLDASALFIFIGMVPATGWLGDLVDLDDHGFVRTGHDARPAECGWQTTALETSQPGVFAVGDVRSGSTKRVATAVGEGAMAIRLAFQRMQSRQGT
jgi:thioredoxin reductase (NADPH)